MFNRPSVSNKTRKTGFSANRFTPDDTHALCKSILEKFCDFSDYGPTSFDHNAYSSDPYGHSFIRDYFCYNLMRKFPFKKGTSATSRKLSALEKFIHCESTCKEANKRIDPSGFVSHLISDDANMVLYHARRNISRILGPFSWDSVVDRCDFGPGASTRLPRSRSSLNNKIRGKLHLTDTMIPLFEAFRNYKPGLFQEYDIVNSNKLVFVPKDSLIDRTIAIEPDFNMFVQKGIGSLIRSRLKTKTQERIDLNDQTVNQDLAKLASLGFGLATVDLSSASDTLCTNLISNLLPIDWFEAINMTRSRYGTFADSPERIKFEKISSMGNGFTFELETLVFYSLCKAISVVYSDGNDCVFVYGDDIIIPSPLYEPLCELFPVYGFTVNLDKSFARGSFFESCGKHYFKGRDVTPVYVKGVPSRVPDKIALINEFILFSWRLGSFSYRDSVFKECIDQLVSTLPKGLQKPAAPITQKGNAIIGDFDECVPRRAKNQFCGFLFKGIVEIPLVSSISTDPSILTESLYILDYRSYSDTTKVEVTLNRFGKICYKDILVPQWTYMGPWI